MDLDVFDHRILRVLRVDGRISNAALAAEVGLSQSACLRRLRALEAGGVIRGYAALIDDPTEALPTVVVIQITLERQTEDHLNRFEAAVRGARMLPDGWRGRLSPQGRDRRHRRL